jgi:hypothetical protein
MASIKITLYAHCLSCVSYYQVIGYRWAGLFLKLQVYTRREAELGTRHFRTVPLSRRLM